MSNKILEGGILINAITDILNDICKAQGGITKDDPRIWQGWLHKRSNEDWHNIISTLDAMRKEEPDIFRVSDSDAIQSAKMVLESGQARALDRFANKSTAWRLTMSIREITNRYYGRKVPNRPNAVKPTPKDTAEPTNYNQLFTQE
jgi:hypothetical protein